MIDKAIGEMKSTMKNRYFLNPFLAPIKLIKDKFSIAIVSLCLVFMGCVAGEGGKKDATCADGQSYDTVSRSCKGARVEDDAPIPTLSATSILEDSGVNKIELTYTDSQNDYARSCVVNSDDSTGLVKQKINQGILYKSQNDIIDPQNTQIFIESGSFLSVVADTSISGLRGVIISVPATASTLSVVTALNTHVTVSNWLQASAISFGNVSPFSGSFALDSIPCTCTGGECFASLEPTEHFYGTTDFSYSLTDDDGTSIDQVVKVKITSVNDNPNITLTGNISGATERFDSDTTSVKSGNLFDDGVISAEDTADGDPFGAYITVQLVSNPTHGIVYLQSDGDYTYYSYKHESADSFMVRVVDIEGGASSNVTIPVFITTVNDPPVGTTPNPVAVLEDSSSVTINLTYTDEEGDSAVSCLVTSVSNVYPDGGCTCAAGSCSVDIAPIPDAKGTGSFSYRIFDTAGNTPASDTVSFNITSVTDSPIVFTTAAGTTLQFLESDTYVPTPYSFSLDGSAHGDSRTITGYSLVTPPSFGTLSGCLGQSGSGLNCTYTPDDGNLSDSTDISAVVPSVDLASTASTDTGTFYATTVGGTYDGLHIHQVDIKGTAESMSNLYGTNAKAYYNNSKITILFERGVTSAADILSAISSNSDVAKLVIFDSSGGTQNTATTLTLNFSGTLPKDSFVYRATDSIGNTMSEKVYISIIPTPDRPTICEYSTYADTTVCGLNGCVGVGTPTAITPDQDGLTYYSKGTGACYMSSGGTWSAVESYIADRSVNELDPIVIDNILADEGGGGSEDGEQLTITNVDSSDTNLIPLGNIEFYYGDMDTPIGTGDLASIPFGDIGSADLTKLKIKITPQTINPPVTQKSSEIEITIADDHVPPMFTEVTFNVNVQKVSATHGGWIFFAATGPKVDSLGLVNEDRTVCPYSLDMCEGGQKCYGSSTPVNNSFADPDHEDAIYLHEAGTSRTCYRMKRTQIQKISYVGKTSNPVSVTYVDNGATADSASVSVSGNSITVTINEDYTTTDTIISVINGNASANALVKAVNLKAGETQDAQSASTVAALSRANWESFETYCNATPAAIEIGCNIGGRSSCVGRGPPSDASINITPTRLDSRYWDEQANVCYKSVATGSSSDWVAYDAPAEVSISWNQFSINGSASVDEYRVYRRLADEDFDFSLPLNKKEISGGSSTYTFIDNNANSVVPPAPGTVYYYVVRPVVNDILTSTAAETGTNSIGVVRMMAPPKNMAFAHRWMINKTMCDLMNRSTDATNNYRCLYTGAGDTNVSGVQYYDFGKDLLVDRYEAGCPYSPAPNCPQTYDNSCIGVTDPDTASIPATNGLTYYNRTNGGCYYASGGSWNILGIDPNIVGPIDTDNIPNYLATVEPNSLNVVSTNPQFDNYSDKQYNRAGLPPLTNISQSESHKLCSGLADLDDVDLLGIQADLSHRLPTRKDQVAYSQWDDSDLTNNEMATLETGLSLNSTSKCNASGASGLEDGYVDIDKPDSNDFYSLPGTFASDIRSMTTGSNELASCVSKFGVQDTIGNVAEWTSHGLSCPLMSTCSSNDNLIIQDIEYRRVRPDGDTKSIGITYINAADAGVSFVSADTAGNILVDLTDFGTPSASAIVTQVNAAIAALGAGNNYLSARVIGEGSNDQFVFGKTVIMGSILLGADDTSFKSQASDPYGFWTLDGNRGPCVDSDADGICDAALTSWAFEDERYSGGRFMTPVGLVSHVSANSTYSTDYDLFEIGPTSGITSLQLHDDTITVNSNIIAGENSGCGGIATGGSYLTGNGAGVWNMEAVPCSDVIGTVTIQDVTFKINDASYADIQIRYIESLTAPTVEEVGGVLNINLSTFSPTATNVAIVVINYFNGLADEVEAFVSGVPDGTQVAFSTPVEFNDYQDVGKSLRKDVGFRCVIDIPNSAYDAD